MGTGRLVFIGSCGPRASSPRYEMVVSSRIKCSSLKDELGIGSHEAVTSKDPCQSSLLLSGGRGGSILNGGRTRSLHD
jgi:hypothetical protein